jgi:phosphoribosyl-ATP pyrophosphohydrolase
MLLKRGEVAIRNKLLEEIGELIIESHRRNKKRLSEELADVFYLTLVLASSHGVRLADIEACLASRHSKGSCAPRSGGSEVEILKRLAPFRTQGEKLSLASLSEATGFRLSRGADVILFSPLLKNSGSRGLTVRRNVFPKEVKALKTYLEGHDLKVKMGVGRGEEVRYVARRSGGVLSVLIYLAQFIVVPVAVKLLADFIKERVDRWRRDSVTKAEGRVEVHLIVAAGGNRKERTYLWEGDIESVHEGLAKTQIGEASKR